MDNCIDCGVELVSGNRSEEQPAIRCVDCFEEYGVEELEKIIREEEEDLEDDEFDECFDEYDEDEEGD